MYRAKTVDSYVDNHPTWKNELTTLRALLKNTELDECIKWGAPCYTYNGDNIIGMMGFKKYVGIWFHQGVFLKDNAGVLVNAQEGKTKALRQWRFSSKTEIDQNLVARYVAEAIQNAKDGRRIKASQPKPLIIPSELAQAFKGDPDAGDQFKKLKPGTQREFADYVSEAKRNDTKIRRIEKIIPMIKSGVGLNDKYK